MAQPARLAVPLALFPELELDPEGGFWDLYGIDGHIGQKTVQCKHDRTIAVSGNIYHEIYEKTEMRDWQVWRKAGGRVDMYLFTTENQLTITGYLVDVNVLAQLEEGRRLIGIEPNGGMKTSMGFVIPLTEFGNRLEKRAQLKRYD